MKEVPVAEPVMIKTVLRSVERPFFRVIVTGFTTLSVLSVHNRKWNYHTPVPVPPDHFKTVGVPASTDVGTDVKPSLDCARAAAINEAPTNRFFTKYISNAAGDEVR